MNGYNFSERVRRSLFLAREEALRLNHEYVGTEHVLLGLLRVDDSSAVDVLRQLDIDIEGIRRTIETTVQSGTTPPRAAVDLPYTSRAKKVLELSMAAARELGHSYVGTEHLLLGLLREGHGIAAQVLNDAGLQEDTADASVRERTGAPRRPAFRPESGPRQESTVTAIMVEVHLADRSILREEFTDPMLAIRFLTSLR
jgi:ATP-dependent Clp protease ATP-binding subunit ClpC